MNIKEYEQKLNTQMHEATITLLRNGDRVLLAMKKRGFGAGKWNGVGGKPIAGENIFETAAREAQEEIGITVKNLKMVAEINFYFPYVANEKGWDQKVFVFITDEWDGDPIETEEMKPQWFEINNIPFEEMWWDDKIWMPLIFAGKRVRGCFMFGEKEEVIDQEIQEY